MTESVTENHPDLWHDKLPGPKPNGHKYDRGHAVIFAATDLTGATRLAAEACSRIGAGLVTVLATRRADVYRTALPPDIMVSDDTLDNVRNPTALLGGCGGLDPAQHNELYLRLKNCTRVFDADAIPAPEDRGVLVSNCILTPHDGEFAKAFPDMEGDRVSKAQDAARASGATMVLKGRETVIAAPDGRFTINTHASPWLAKAGTGDVLAGMIAGLAAQGMEPFDAASAAAWMHGEAGRRIGPGLIAGDISAHLREILHQLFDHNKNLAAS